MHDEQVAVASDGIAEQIFFTMGSPFLDITGPPQARVFPGLDGMFSALKTPQCSSLLCDLLSAVFKVTALCNGHISLSLI